MATNYADDEQINESGGYSGDVSEITKAGRIRVTTINRKEAPLAETNLKALVEVTGAEIGRDRLGADIVTVLDVTDMDDDSLQKLNQIKIAMKFLINKLSPIDRLSVITVSRASTTRNSPLLQMTESSKRKVENLVNDLKLVDESNNSFNETTDGAQNCSLQTALQVLNGRTLKAGRVPAIMLVICNCEPKFDAENTDINVPVYTFGLGPKYDEKVLNEISMKSMGGTFSIADVQNKPTYSNLSAAFLQCLAGLLTVVVQDLKLIIKSTVNSKIHKVSAGKYSKLKNEDDDMDTKTVSFANLYCKEKRRVMVDLQLEPVDSEEVEDVLEITYSYKIGDISFEERTPLCATIKRTKTTFEQEAEEVTIEAARLRTVEVIEKAIQLADNGEFDEAQDIIVEAQNKLEDDVDEPKESLEILKYELYKLIQFMQSKETYKSFGHAFALASHTSHDSQRVAARGDLKSNPPMFTTPLMDKFVKQLIAFDKNNSMVGLPSIVDDLEQEIANNPIAAFAGALSFHVEKLIQTLKIMQDKVNIFHQVGVEGFKSSVSR
ncbi:E3 ubiquitin-protein ligase WAV3 [Bienertia sinuspersici]